MARNLRFLIAMSVAVALAVPTLAEAQATRRGGSSGSSSGSSGSSGSAGSTGSSSSGSAGSTSSGASRRTAPPASSTSRTAVRRPSSSSTSSGEGSTGRTASRTATERTTAGVGAPGIRDIGGRTAVLRPGTASTAGSSLIPGRRSRDRGGLPVTGVAVERPLSDVRIIYYPFVGPWGRWYPWYSSGLGWGGFGYMWYDPFYSPYYYRYPYGYPYNLYYRQPSPSLYSDDVEDEELTGAIRFRVDPDDARIYINGALVGSVDDFNGLKDHLNLPAGVHQLEVRAEGYETYVAELTVEAGKTRTERFSLERRRQ